KKTHSSSLEEHEAEKVRAHFKGSAEASSASKPTRSARPSPDEIKTKIDLSHISKPGDVLKAIISRQQPTTAPPAHPGPPIPPASAGRPGAGPPDFTAAPPTGAPPRALGRGGPPPIPPRPPSPGGCPPMGGGPGLAPPSGSTRPGSRPGGPSRRPGQRYVPRGV